MTVSENPKPVTAYCRACGKPLTEDTARVALGTVYCEEHLPPAAQTQAQAASPYSAANIPNPGVSPGLAFLLGLMPGVGAIYNGQYAKGLVHVLILGLLISIMSSGASNGLEPLFGMILGVFYFYMAFEAYHTARKRMMGEPVDEFSSLVQVKSGPGSLPVLPIVLIGLGVLFLLNNLELLRLRAVLRYWPVVLIVAGGWMLYARLTDGAAAPKPAPAEPESTVPPTTGGAM
jgi:TM2 domain-containing membrane protein YozV